MFSYNDLIMKRYLKKIKDEFNIDYAPLDYKGNIKFDNTPNPVITQGAIFDLGGILYNHQTEINDILKKFTEYISINKYEIINGHKCIHTDYVSKFKQELS